MVAATDEAGTGGLGVMVTKAGIGISGPLGSLKRRSISFLEHDERRLQY